MPTVHLYTTPTLKAQKKIAEKQMRRLLEPKNQGVCCKILSLNDVRNFTPKISLTLLPKHEVNKNNINRHAKVGRAKNPGGYRSTQITCN